MTHQHIVIEDTVYFWFGSNDTSGSGDDGAAAAADVRLAGAAAGAIPVLSPVPTLLTHANYPAGCYEVAVAATVANGFASGNTYAVFCTLTVDAQNPTGFVGSFTTAPIIANTVEISDDSAAADNLESACDNYSVTRGLSGTALPAAVADAAGGLPVSDAGGLDLDTQLANTNEVTAARMGALTDWINGGRLDLILDIIAADVVNLDGDAMRGTDTAALASVCTEARLAELDAANLPTDIADIPTVAEFEARTIVAASYFDPGADTVANVTLVDTTTTNTDVRGTDNAALASICTEARLAELAAANIPADVDTLLTRLSAANAQALVDWINGGRLDLILDIIAADVVNLDGDAMRGTNGANTTTPPTAAAIVNEWETQSQADPTGFHVNVLEIEGSDATDQIRDAVVDDATRIDASALNTLSGHDPGGTLCLDATPLTAAETESEVNDALVALKLDHLVAVAEADDPVDDSIVAKLAASDGDWSGFSEVTDSLEAIRDRGDAAWTGGGAAPTVEEIRTEMDDNSTQLAAIVADTNELQGDWTNGGRLDLIIDAILADTNELQTDDIPGLIAALNDLSAAQVNAEVLDVLNVDTFAEPGQGAPTATATIQAKIAYLYKAWRNKIVQDSMTLELYNDAGAVVDQKSTVSDDGTDYTRGEIGSGP